MTTSTIDFHIANVFSCFPQVKDSGLHGMETCKNEWKREFGQEKFQKFPSTSNEIDESIVSYVNLHKQKHQQIID